MRTYNKKKPKSEQALFRWLKITFSSRKLKIWYVYDWLSPNLKHLFIGQRFATK